MTLENGIVKMLNNNCFTLKSKIFQCRIQPVYEIKGKEGRRKEGKEDRRQGRREGVEIQRKKKGKRIERIFLLKLLKPYPCEIPQATPLHHFPYRTQLHLTVMIYEGIL